MLAASRQLRSDLALLTSLAASDLAHTWAQVHTPEEAKAALNDVLPGLLVLYAAAAGTVGADWYDDLRESQGVGGSFRAIVPVPPADLGAAELAGYGIGPLFGKAPDWSAAKTLIAGGVQRRIVNSPRASVVHSSLADPHARGWVRVGVGECDWCQQYLDGEVHYVQGYDFLAHDHCQCTASPVFT